MLRALLVVAAAGVAAVVLFVVALVVSDSPQFWTASVLALVCFVALRRSRQPRMRVVCWNVGAILLVWALFDIGARALDRAHAGRRLVPRAALALRLGPMPNVLAVRDSLLGYRLPPGGHREEGGASYDIDADGLRVGPPPRATPDGCVLFFGCSFTFGEGVDDDQTFAYRVEVRTDGRFRSRNFGVSGSGPHYALGQVEGGTVERAAHCAPTHAMYLVLPHHLVRVRGRFAASFGPRYAVAPDGSAIQTGTLNRSTPEFAFDMLRYTSALYVAKFGYESAPDAEDVRLTVAILKTLNDRLQARYPGIRFAILYWNDNQAPAAVELGARLPSIGVPVFLASQIFPGDQPQPIYLPDGHPTPWAHDRVAEYLVANLLASGN